MPYELPTYDYENLLRAEGATAIAGVDEAGAGCWAGPVFAGAVILEPGADMGLLRDSKTMSEKQREEAYERIIVRARAWAVGYATAKEIDEINIRKAGALAMRRALNALTIAPDRVLSDAFVIPGLAVPCRGIVKGDAKVMCISAGAIIAKVSRDRHMQRLAYEHPAYAFDRHKGYGTKAHAEALDMHGPCAEHRMTYEPVRAAVERRTQRA
jgi:ribonuclease HII